MPPVHDSAVAAVQPRAAQQVEHDLGQRRARRWRTRTRPGRPSSARAARRRPPRRAGLGADVDLDLEVARADARLDAGRVAAGRGEQVGDVRLADAVGADQPAPPRLARGRTAARATGWSGAIAHSRRSSDGTPGSTTTCASPTAITSPGAVPAMPEHLGARRDLRLLAVAGVEPARGRGRSARRPRRSSGRSAPAPPRRARARRRPPAASASTVRSSCVGPSPPDVTTRSADSSIRRRPARMSASSSPTTSVRRSEKPSRSRAAARCGAVLVGDDPPQELVAREQDGGGRPAQAAWAPAESRRSRCPAATCGRITWRPLMASVTLPGAPKAR